MVKLEGLLPVKHRDSKFKVNVFLEGSGLSDGKGPGPGTAKQQCPNIGTPRLPVYSLTSFFPVHKFSHLGDGEIGS